MSGAVVFDPLLPWSLVGAVALLALAFVGLSLLRRLSGWWLRGLAAAALLAAVANPSLQDEERTGLSDIVILVVDRSASQQLSDRQDQTQAAIARVEAEVASLPNTELRVVELGDDPENRGSLLMTRLAEAVAEEPRARIAGAILLTDGQLHDVEAAPSLPAPLHVLLTGREDDWDRRLVIQNAPAFAILGEPVTLTVRVEDQGAVPGNLPPAAELEVRVDGGEPERFDVPVDRDMDLAVTLPHGGTNVIQFSLAEVEGELTDRNNAAVVQINGVRDRLRVLLVSGEPHPGERTWRNLLKSDSSVDLVHFTILRPPEKQDGVPVDELSLIAFPTRELFLDKIEEFDLIIFDRYRRRGILPSIYLDNIRGYVEEGGALLIAAGPDYAAAESLYRSPLADVLPAAPTGRVMEEPYLPEITEIGDRHPVTEGLEQLSEAMTGTEAAWGRWLRLIDVTPEAGHTLMAGLDDRPLLVLDRVGEGRVALLASDHAWLWNRGFEGGGPQLELLRRLSHWLMKEPELEEDALAVTAEGRTMTIVRRTLEDEVGDVEVTGPDGTTETVELEQTSPGRFTTDWTAPTIGLYRLREGDAEAVIALGPASPREFEETIATGEKAAPAVDATGGGIRRVEEEVPDLRQVRSGRTAEGRGWLGITPREAYLTTDVSIAPFLPAWAWLLLASALIVGAWLREGRS